MITFNAFSSISSSTMHSTGSYAALVPMHLYCTHIFKPSFNFLVSVCMQISGLHKKSSEIIPVKCGWQSSPSVEAVKLGCPAFVAHCWPVCWWGRQRWPETAWCSSSSPPVLDACLQTTGKRERFRTGDPQWYNMYWCLLLITFCFYFHWLWQFFSWLFNNNILENLPDKTTKTYT